MSPFVIYSRKSTDDDDSQVQSLPDQEWEMKSLAAKLNITLGEPLSEAKSAKAPGRPVFNSLMERVERGEVTGILCWKLDRLARNPVDGGRIIWAMKQQGLVVRTPHQTFSRADDNLILMYIEFGMAQKYVDDLGRNTTRGLESKAKKGWYPGVAPLGYLNSKIEERGNKTVLSDPDRFAAVRRMWDLMLTSTMSPARIQRLANTEWNFRTRRTKRTGGNPVSRSTIYKMFSDPFYAGRFEYPKGSGKWYEGAHEPMVTEAEFQCVQTMLHQDTNPRPQKEFALPFRGLIKCGECGSSITAHFREQVRCTRCHYKSSVKHRESCSKCLLPISEMRAPKRRRYAYYHCTRKLNPLCRQKVISATALDAQITEKLKAFRLPSELRDWGLHYIEKLHSQELHEERQILVEKKKAFERCMTQLEQLVKLKTSPENADGSLLSDDEYQKQRAELLAQKNTTAVDSSTFQIELNKKADMLKRGLTLVGTIEELSSQEAVIRKREVLSALGLNHVLMGKELEIRPEFPFSELPGQRNMASNGPTPIEPQNIEDTQRRNDGFRPANPSPERDVDEDRTKAMKKSLETIWKKIDVSSPIFTRYPFTEDQALPSQPRRRGKFISPRDASSL